ncbi:MAG: hypothetical protein KGM47_13945 [Acidobacteriota bacterium]|nr:hypothetical protein [Acidobacteriota bacterium]
MNCDHYQAQIHDLALGDSEKQNASIESALQRHLAVCAACREELERARVLAARIDDAIKGSLAFEPSPRFASQVQQQIARNAGRSESAYWPRFHSPRWIAAAVICAIVLTAGVIWKTQSISLDHSRGAAIETAEKPRTENLEHSGLEAKKGPRSSKGRLTVATPLPTEMAAASATTKTAYRPLRTRTRRRPDQQTPQVLVPKDQMALILQLYYGTRTGVIDGASLVVTPPGFKREPDGTLAAVPIEIKPLEIAKLSSTSSPAEAP